MARKSSGTVPPHINLKECIDIAKWIYERGGGSMSLDDVAALIKSTIKSSSFVMKMGAMRGFGLILTTDGKSAQLTQLGKAIVAPTSQDEQRMAILQAFNSISIYESLHQKYQGGFLPEDTFLANTVVKEFSSPSEYKEKWLKSFKDSGKAAGILRDEGAKVRVLQTPSLTGGYMSQQRQATDERQDIREELERQKQDFDQRQMSTGSFPIVLDDKRSVIVPLDFSRDDLDYLHGVLELYVKRRETRGV